MPMRRIRILRPPIGSRHLRGVSEVVTGAELHPRRASSFRHKAPPKINLPLQSLKPNRAHQETWNLQKLTPRICSFTAFPLGPLGPELILRPTPCPHVEIGTPGSKPPIPPHHLPGHKRFFRHGCGHPGKTPLLEGPR